MNIDDLLNENARLKKENEYLRNVLKINNINLNNITFDKNCAITNLDVENKIDIFMSYFKGRMDCYASRYYDKDKNKKYYLVCEKSELYCQDKIKIGCKKCQARKNKKLSREVYKKHLKSPLFGKNSYSIGIYPMLDNDCCYFLALDFDGENSFENASLFKRCCKKYDIDCVVEISQSGQGAHCWIFFEEEVKASIARKIGDFILNKIYLVSTGIKLSSFDRFYPSQDTLEKEGKGSLIALPLNGEAVKEGRTAFVDENKIPYQNQIAYLKSIRKINKDSIEKLLILINQDDSIEYIKSKFIKNPIVSFSDFIGIVEIFISKNIRINKSSLTSKSLKYLMRLGSIPNHNFYKLQRIRKSTYNVQRTLILFEETEKYLYLPRGCYDDLLLILKTLKVNYNVIDNTNCGKPIDVEFNGVLKPAQLIAVNKMLEKNNGILIGPPGFGKTVSACALISKLKVNTLTLVHTKNLLDQWKEKLNKFLKINYEPVNNEYIGICKSTKNKATFKIDVATIQSFDDSKESYEILSKYGLIIQDEVHHLGAPNYEAVIKNTNSKYLYGLTATIKRSDYNEGVVLKRVGNIIYEHKEDYKSSPIKKYITPVFTKFRVKYNGKEVNYTDKCNILVEDIKRNQLILEYVKESLNKDRHIILLSDRIRHLDYLHKELLKFNNNVFLITGKTKVQEKNDLLNKINNLNGISFVLLSTSKSIGEGFDMPILDTLFLTMPFKWEGNLKQYVGRLDRDYNDKTEVFVYDFVDPKVTTFYNMFSVRLRGYKKYNYEILDSKEEVDTVLYNNNTYMNNLKNDFEYSSCNVIIYIKDYEFKLLEEYLEINKDTKVFIYGNIKEEIAKENVILEKTIHNYNFIIIDNKIVWYGDLNPFVNNNFYRSIVRVDDKDFVSTILKEIEDLK